MGLGHHPVTAYLSSDLETAFADGLDFAAVAAAT